MTTGTEGPPDKHLVHSLRAPEVIYPYEDEVSFIDYLKIVWKWRWMIVALCVFAMFSAMILSIKAPRVYEAKVTMMLPAQTGGVNLSGLFGGGGGGSVLQMLGGGGDSSASQMVLALLQSRTMAEKIAKDFDLVTRFGVTTIQSAAGQLKGMTEIDSESGIISIIVESQEPKLSAELANHYVVVLNRINQSMSLTAAKRNRMFVEERMNDNFMELKRTEDDIKNFQLANMSVFLESQVAGSMGEAEEIQNKINLLEMELKVRGASLQAEHPDLRKLDIELEYLQKRLNRVEVGPTGKGLLPGKRIYPAWSSVPDLSVQLRHYNRELEVREEVYVLLAGQLEQAKIEEIKDDPTVQVLDSAIAPTGASNRPTEQVVLGAGILAFLLGVFLAFLVNSIANSLAQQAQRQKGTAVA